MKPPKMSLERDTDTLTKIYLERPCFPPQQQNLTCRLPAGLSWTRHNCTPASTDSRASESPWLPSHPGSALWLHLPHLLLLCAWLSPHYLLCLRFTLPTAHTPAPSHSGRSWVGSRGAKPDDHAEHFSGKAAAP